MPICPKCGNIGLPQDKFCRKCGSPIKPEIHCKKCGNIAQPKDRFCVKCGSPLGA
ncbi:MAG: zinc-ribbon domain-containing protein [Chloroflexota bacterium]